MKRSRVHATQTPILQQSEFGSSFRSYHRNENESPPHIKTFRDLLTKVIPNKEITLQWCFDNKVISNARVCTICNSSMHMAPKTASSDGLRWRCRKKDHEQEQSLRKGSWLEKSNLTMEEVIELTYWWAVGTPQHLIKSQMKLSDNTIVDWSNFCREVCEEIVLERSSPIGGQGVRVQIDESKFGKRKYHRGRRVDGVWVFGGIEEESRKNFLVAVEKRDRETLIPIIQRWIKPGSIIISDFWKPYDVLNELGYTHCKVNHSVEYVNEDGDHTNKIEGH